METTPSSRRDLVALLAQEALNKKLITLRKENLEHALASIQAKREALKSADEKKQDLAAQEAEIRKALGLE